MKTTAEFNKMLLENEAFRHEFITNTRAVCEKHGIKVGEVDMKAFDAAVKSGKQAIRCVICDASPQAYLICEF